jgi:hypothetical protein
MGPREVHNGLVAYRWQLVVEDSFQITGRGLVVVGAFEGIGNQDDEACVETSKSTFSVDHVRFEVLTEGREGRPAIMLGDLDKDQVPIGAVIHSVY